MAEVATRSSWKLLAQPEYPRPLAVSLTFDQPQMERLRRGLIPRQMEERWFVFFEDGCLYVCRSWTGEIMFGVHLEETAMGSRASRAWVSADGTPFAGRDEEGYRAILNDAVSAVLERA